LLLLNLSFYSSPPVAWLWGLVFLWLYLIVFWGGVQLYIFPVLVGLQQPTVVAALRTAVVLAFANPFFSILLVALAALLTGLSVVLAILLILAWPALMILMGEHSLKLFVERAGGAQAGQNTKRKG
jgi:hypothetical protein